MMIVFRYIFLLVMSAIPCLTISRHLSSEDVLYYKEKLKSMFDYAYDSYLRYAEGYDELKPISCQGMNYTEFQRAMEYVIKNIDLDQNINVSVFESNIRVVGGLLSAHLLSHKTGIKLEPGWPCKGPLLDLAEKVARKLLPAFQTRTGMPYGTVNLKYGVPKDETPVTCTAGVGTFILEFSTLSRLTGDPVFEETALKAIYALHESRSKFNMVGNHINTTDGRWTAIESSIGGGVDSFFEYLVKGAIILQMPELMEMFNIYYRAIRKHMKRDDWFFIVHMNNGLTTMPVFQSLEAFFPGLLTLIGDIDQAKKSLLNYHYVLKKYGFIPEFFDISNNDVKNDGCPLRPEFSESLYYLYRATKDPIFRSIGIEVIESIEYSAKTSCGFATIKNVLDHTIEDRMESFFLAETLKYLYLLFDDDNFINSRGNEGVEIDVNGKKCIIEVGGYIFNTEAHPIDVAVLNCCTAKSPESILKENVDFYSVLSEELREQRNIRKALKWSELELENIPRSPLEPLFSTPLAYYEIMQTPFQCFSHSGHYFHSSNHFYSDVFATSVKMSMDEMHKMANYALIHSDPLETSITLSEKLEIQENNYLNSTEQYSVISPSLTDAADDNFSGTTETQPFSTSNLGNPEVLRSPHSSAIPKNNLPFLPTPSYSPLSTEKASCDAKTTKYDHENKGQSMSLFKLSFFDFAITKSMIQSGAKLFDLLNGSVPLKKQKSLNDYSDLYCQPSPYLHRLTKYGQVSLRDANLVPPR